MSLASAHRAHGVQINYLKRLGYTDWISARILWNLGFFFQPLRLLDESIEKYLNALWLQSRPMRSSGTRVSAIKKTPAQLFHSLPRAVQRTLHEEWEAWRRAGATSEAGFRAAERLIRSVRIALDEHPRRNFLEEWEGLAAIQYSPLKRTRLTQVMKGILALKNPPLTKRLKRQYARKIRQIAALFQRA